ncbi:MAG: hypothetical protein GY765_35075 [bacterium]|nr:hypothetical protein [bacterium]
MWHYILTGIIILLAFVAVMLGKPDSKVTEESYKKEVVSRFLQDGNLDRGEIESMLRSLPNSLERQLKPGAMCYSVTMVTIDKGTYTCPLCGSKTLYSGEDKYFPGNVDEFIPEFRRLVQQVKGVGVKLVEKQFCKKCSPNCKEPKLVLEITLPGDNTVHKVVDFWYEDLELLVAFTTGEVIHKAEREREVMLKKYKPRLEKLLGIEVPAKK